MHHRIAAKELKIGMFIADLDRPWIDTPFLLQGFLLEDEEQLVQLREHCEWVMVDPHRSVGAEYEFPAKKLEFARRDLGAEPRVMIQHKQRPADPKDRKGSVKLPAARPSDTPKVAARGTSASDRISYSTVDVRNAGNAESRDTGHGRSTGPQSEAGAQEATTGRRGGLRNLWGDLRQGVTNILAGKDKDNYDYDAVPETVDGPGVPLRPAFIPETVQLTIYEDATSVEDEIGPAADSFKRTSDLLHSIADDVRAGDDLKLENIEAVIDDMVESMVRNPDALMWVARMREQDLNIYSHGISVAVSLVAFGRHLGYPKTQLTHLGMLGLLLDVGKIKLPRELLEKHGRLNAEEFEQIKDHVELGLNILHETPNIHPDVLEGIAQHHERMNGSGYPNNLMGDKISTFGRMGAIADTYAAVTKPRPYADVISPHQALQMLTTWSGSQFQADMVEQFIQSIGVFPVGSMVELSTGEVAVVVTHNKFKRLRPKVLVLTEPDKTVCANPATRDLLYDVSDNPVYIRGGLPSKAYGLDPREYYVG
jgi:HD-GYP domain-containing protein (c-di-GMP phosphodiesterase class II)